MACNPCLCWNLKDGCVTVGIWSLIFCIAQMGIFGWQIAAIKYYKDRAGNNLLPVYGSYDTYDNRFPGYYERYYESPEERFYTALFVVQILALIAAFFLLFASVALIYGIHTNSRHLVWPWFPCMIAVTLCSIAYCVIWWTGDIRDYWLVLTIIQIITVLVNIYCILCVVIQYRRIVRGIAEPDYYYRQYQPKDQIIYSSGPGGETRTKILPQQDFYYPEPETKTQEGQWNPAYADTDPYGNVQLYTHPGPVHELPTKTPLVETMEQAALGPPPEKTQVPFTEQWLDHLAESNADIPRHVSEPSSPTKIEVEGGVRPARSVPSIHSGVREKSRHQKRHRSSSVGSNSRRSRKSSRSTSSEDDSCDSDDDKSRKDRRRHHRSQSRDRQYSDTDTGYSRSDREGGRRRHHHHHHHKRRHHRSKDREDRDRDRDRDKEKSKRSKRPRDVKREDKERLDAKNEPPVVPPRPGSAGTDLNSWPPKYSPAPPYSGPAGANPAAITIPQHIVIPPNAGKGGHPGKPQRFHINSEITISYSDRSTIPSDTEAARKGGWEPRITPISGPTVTSPTDGEDGDLQGNNRASYGAESTDSKGYGSTAV